MALERFTDAAQHFRPARREMVARANAIIGQYLAQGLRLTLRQLHYQFVTRFPEVGNTGKAPDGGTPYRNNPKSYKQLGNCISEARLGGVVDWRAIEDRGRVPTRHSQWDSLSDLVDSAVRGFRLPRWEGQKTYVELWVEKDALAGVLEPMADEFHATLMVNKGYSSQSAMYDASKRYLAYQKQRKNLVLFYLGDHDPSGEDMVRDIDDRLKMFGVRGLDVQKLALTPAQIEEYDPPPNPVKMDDSRSDAYVAEHGAECWEVDALEPTVLQQIIREAFEGVVDRKLMDAVIRREQTMRRQLKHATMKMEGRSLDELCDTCEIFEKLEGQDECYDCHYADEEESEGDEE